MMYAYFDKPWEEKQKCPEICYYGYGYYLFYLLENTPDDKEKESLQDLYLKYKTGKGNVQEAKKFFKNGYPSKESDYLDYLKSIYK